MHNKSLIKGFALVEILIAITILSIVLLSVYTGVSAGISVITGTKNYTRAMILAKTKMNEFILRRMREPDITLEPIEEYSGFYLTRKTERFEHDILGPIPAKKTDIIISWKENKREKKYMLSYIFSEK